MALRIHAIDAVRGFCLLNIFINHVTVGIVREISISKIGLSDTAEIFVFLAGLSAYLFSRRKNGMSIFFLWRRALTLYCVNVGVISTTIVILLISDYVTGDTSILDGSVKYIFTKYDFMDISESIFMFRQEYGYSVVLRLYVFLMILAPALIWLSNRSWWYALPPAVLIWMAAGHFDLVVRNNLTGDLLALTLLPWILIFTCGVALGAAMTQGVRLPQSRLLLGAALVYVIGFVVLVSAILPHWPAAQAWFETRNDHFWLGGSKTYQSPARVLHALAVVYVFIACAKAPVIRLFHEVEAGNVLCRLGRASLPVFAFGAIAAVVADEIVYSANLSFGARSLRSIAIELTVVALAFAIMIAIADRCWRFKAKPASGRPAKPLYTASGVPAFPPDGGGSVAKRDDVRDAA
jgi:hypothetical protein